MQYYFIGGLGGNGSHLAPLNEKLGFPVTFLDPYREMDSDRKRSSFLVSRSDRPGGRDLFIGAFLGWRFGSLSSSEFPQIRALILLDGGYLDMEKILSLEEELEGTASFMQQQVFATLEKAVLAELGDGSDPYSYSAKSSRG